MCSALKRSIPRSGKMKPAIVAVIPDKSTICTVGTTIRLIKIPRTDHSEKKNNDMGSVASEILNEAQKIFLDLMFFFFLKRLLLAVAKEDQTEYRPK